MEVPTWTHSWRTVMRMEVVRAMGEFNISDSWMARLTERASEDFVRAGASAG